MLRIREISNLFSKQKQGCIVIAGDDIQQLSQAFHDNGYTKHVYQLLHIHNQKGFSIDAEEKFTLIRLNLTDTSALKGVLKHIDQVGHKIELCIFQPSFKAVEDLDDCKSISSMDTARLWQDSGLSAVSFAQVMITAMLKHNAGTLIFLGGQYHASNHDDLFSQSVFAAVRALSQSLAREFQPKGIHIAFMMLEHWNSHQENLMQSIKKSCWHVHQQPSSTWSQELSL